MMISKELAEEITQRMWEAFEFKYNIGKGNEKIVLDELTDILGFEYTITLKRKPTPVLPKEYSDRTSRS